MKIKRITFRIMATCVLLAMTKGGVWAQEVPGNISPDRAADNYRERPEALSQERTAREDEDQNDLIPKLGDESFIPFAVSGARFLGFGGSPYSGELVSEERLAALVRERLSGELPRNIAAADILNVEKFLTAELRNQGHILSQAIVDEKASRANGVLTIIVVEGFVDQVRFEGVLSEHRVIAKLAQTSGESGIRPFKISDLERPLLLLNDRAGIAARSFFRNVPGETAPGSSTLFIRTEKTAPVTGYLSLNNRGNQSSGPYQVDAGVQLHGIAGLGELTRFRVIQTTQLSELTYVRADTSIPLGQNGLRVNLGGSFSDGKPGAPILRLIDHVSDGWSLQAGLSYPLIRSRSQNLSVRFGSDFSNSESDQLGALAINDRLRLFRAGFDYDIADSLGGINQFSFTLTKGVGGLGATANVNPLASRFQGKTSFEKAEFYASRRQRISRTLQLKISASGQVANEILLSPEECGIGGLGFGRAYDNSEITGEECLAGSAELSWSLPTGKTGIERLNLYGFIEGGSAWNQGRFLADRKDSLVAAGFGKRIGLPWGFSAEAEVAFPLSRRVASEGNKDPRLFFRLTKTF